MIDNDPELATHRIVVFGSVNLDTYHSVPWMPVAGETVVGLDTRVGLGGKGANQAVAAARAGIPVIMLGAIGSDDAAVSLRRKIAAEGVDVTHLAEVEAPSGGATILVDREGANLIVVTPGANGIVSAEYAEENAHIISSAQVLVLQGELSVSAVKASIRIAEKHGVRTVVNLAPFLDLGNSINSADPLIVNEIEAGQMTGATVDSVDAAISAARRIAETSTSAVVTLGELGAVVAAAGTVRHFPARTASTVLDTTGAGDAFVGVLAAALSSGASLHHAVIAGIEAGTLAVGVDGAAESYPSFAHLLNP